MGFERFHGVIFQRHYYNFKPTIKNSLSQNMFCFTVLTLICKTSLYLSIVYCELGNRYEYQH